MSAPLPSTGYRLLLDDEKDERFPGVWLIDSFGDDEKRTIEQADEGWYVRDWETTSNGTEKFWFSRFGYLVDSKVLDAILRVKSGEGA